MNPFVFLLGNPLMQRCLMLGRVLALFCVCVCWMGQSLHSEGLGTLLFLKNTVIPWCQPWAHGSMKSPCHRARQDYGSAWPELAGTEASATWEELPLTRDVSFKHTACLVLWHRAAC